MKNVWVITNSVNAYDQYGDYLIAVFIEKPNIEQIIKLLKCNEIYALHILDQKGRFGTEDSWYHLSELKEGELYKNR